MMLPPLQGQLWRLTGGECPTNGDTASGHRECSVLGGIRRQFMQRHRQGKRHARGEAQVWSPDLEALTRQTAVGLQHLSDDLAKLRTFPVLTGENVVSTGQGKQTLLKRLQLGTAFFMHVAEGLSCDRLHSGQRVLYTMVQLVDEEPLALFPELAP